MTASAPPDRRGAVERGADRQIGAPPSPSPSPSPALVPSRPSRASGPLLLALGVGLAAAAFAWFGAQRVTPNGDARSDFDHLWFAARVLWAGGDPYAAIGPHAGAAFRFQWPLYYPLTTVVAVLPLAALPLPVARAVFVGAPAALLAWYLARRSPWHPLGLLSYGVIDALGAAQWSVLTTAAALTPLAGGLLALKPQAALAWVLATLSPRLLRDVAIVGLSLLAVSLWLEPEWIPRWLRTVSTATHVRPLIVRPLAWPLLLALTRWRRLEARVLLAVALVPITPAPYELVPLLVVPRSRVQMLALVLCTWVAYAVQYQLVVHVAMARRVGVAQDALLALVFLPALALVLRRPNVGAVPAWTADLARWVRARGRLPAAAP